MKVDTAVLPPARVKKPSLANPWERVEGGSLHAEAEQTRLAGQAAERAGRASGAGVRSSSARAGAPPRRSEEAQERTQRSIEARRQAAAKHVPKTKAPIEHEVPEAWNLERRWSWG